MCPPLWTTERTTQNRRNTGPGIGGSRCTWLNATWSRLDQPEYVRIDASAFASKNVYNQANYQIRQAFIHEGTYLPYAEIFHRVKGMDCYHALPAKVANSILILLHKNWLAFFEALEAYNADPSRFTGRPRLPKYSGLGEGA